MAQARWTSHPTVRADCPVCDRPLPPIMVDVDARADGGSMIGFEVTLQELDGPWWDAAAVDHPGCGIELARRRYLRAVP